jgi:hypothetical protein
MLLALKLLVVLGVLSYALAAVLGERELVVHSHALPSSSTTSTASHAAAAASAAFQHPLHHFVRAPRGHGPHHAGNRAGKGPQQGEADQLMLGRRVRGWAVCVGGWVCVGWCVGGCG